MSLLSFLMYLYTYLFIILSCITVSTIIPVTGDIWMLHSKNVHFFFVQEPVCVALILHLRMQHIIWKMIHQITPCTHHPQKLKQCGVAKHKLAHRSTIFNARTL